MFESVIFKQQKQQGCVATETDRQRNPITGGTVAGRFPECARTALKNVYISRLINQEREFWEKFKKLKSSDTQWWTALFIIPAHKILLLYLLPPLRLNRVLETHTYPYVTSHALSCINVLY
jgi:hypothetical protein